MLASEEHTDELTTPARRVKERRQSSHGGLVDYFARARWMGLAWQCGASFVTVLLCWSMADPIRLFTFLLAHQFTLAAVAITFVVPFFQRFTDKFGVPLIPAWGLVGSQLVGASVLWFDLSSANSLTFTLAASGIMFGSCAFTLVTLGPVKTLSRMAVMFAILPSAVAAMFAGHTAFALAFLLFTVIMGAYGVPQMHRAYTKFILGHSQNVNDVAAAQALAREDPLTGLHNRVGISYFFQNNRESYRSAFFIDLDRFKKVNDEAGHLAGDRLLRGVATRLTESAPEGSAISRVGGDEFMILMPLSDCDELVELGKQVIALLEEPFSLSGSTYSISASIGVALIDSASTLERVFHESDNAMFRAKRTGRGRVTVFTEEMETELRARESLEKEVYWLIDRGKFPVYGQPVYDLNTGAINSVELLVRPKLRNGNRLPPALLLPVLEELKLIDVLTISILKNAIQARAKWREIPELANVPISINVPPLALAGDWLLPELRALVSTYKLKPGELIFEVTEQAIAQDSEKSHENLKAMRETGVDLVLDDFGVGYSSLSLLLNLPVSAVKVDRSIVQSADQSKVGGRFLQAIIEVARSLDLDVVAEGVETRDQLISAHKAGANLGQGYLFARPKPLDLLVAKLIDQPNLKARTKHPLSRKNGRRVTAS